MKRTFSQTLNRHSGVRWRSALGTGAAAMLFFVAFTGLRVTAQGLYADELVQATGSFAYVGAQPIVGAVLTIRGIPVLNLSYLGAIKTAVYGLYLKWFGAHFSVGSWRLVSIFFVGCGILLFCLVARHGLSLRGLVTFVLLFLTDVAIVLGTRYDWGGVGLALLLRLLFIATWLQGETHTRPPLANTCLLSVLVGLAVFEKLSSVVLVVPLMLMLILNAQRRSLRHWLACLAGLMVGGAPLIGVNVYTFLRDGRLISLQDILPGHPEMRFGFAVSIFTYLSLSSGGGFKTQLGELALASAKAVVEAGIACAVLLLVALMVVRYWKQHRYFRMAGIMLLSYGGVRTVLEWFPRATWVNHWILGTPFQYVAIALTLMGLSAAKAALSDSGRFVHRWLSPALAFLLISRLVGIVSLGTSLLRGEASDQLDPSLTTIGHFAAERAGEAVFLTANWGVGPQLYCLSDGRPDLVYGLDASHHIQDDIRGILEQTQKKTVYVIFHERRRTPQSGQVVRILREMRHLPGWEEQPVEHEVAALGVVGVRKFAYLARDPV